MEEAVNYFLFIFFLIINLTSSVVVEVAQKCLIAVIERT